MRSFLRKVLIRRRVYTPCCASCGEMPSRPEKRLCASLSVTFPVDAVLVPAEKGAENTSAFVHSIAGLQKYCPWLRLLFFAPSGDELPDIPSVPAKLRPVRKRDFPASSAGFDTAYAAHSLPGLSEQYLLVRAGSAPERDMLPLDFFSPNGIPFLFLDAAKEESLVTSGIFAQTRENSADFLACLQGAVPPLADCLEYFTSVGRWACSVGRSVPLYR
jgi:hypothetical protein